VFPQATVFDKAVLQAAELLVEQIVCLVDQADDRIGRDFEVGVFRLRRIVRMRPIRAIAWPSHHLRLGMGLAPDRWRAHRQEVAIVRQQFSEIRPGHIRQLDLGFLGRAGGHAALHDIRLAGPGRLNQMIMGAAAPVDEVVADVDRAVEDNSRFLVGEQFLVARMGRDTPPTCATSVRGRVQAARRAACSFSRTMSGRGGSANWKRPWSMLWCVRRVA
jgi:hypothetical protein